MDRCDDDDAEYTTLRTLRSAEQAVKPQVRKLLQNDMLSTLLDTQNSLQLRYK